MTLAFLNIGSTEFALIFIVLILIVIAVANYGKDTALGYWGSIALALLTSPIVALIVILFLKNKKPTAS